MGIFGGNGCGGGNNNEWIWIAIIVIFVLCYCDSGNNLIGNGNSGCCEDPCC